MRNRFCPLSETHSPSPHPPPPPPLALVLAEGSSWVECRPKSNEKYTPVLHCISSFQGATCYYEKLL